MKHTKLYPILFEADDSTTLIDPKAIAQSVGDVILPEIEKLGNRFEKQSKEVSTTSLSTTGAKPAAGSRESGTDKKIDDIKTQTAKAQTSDQEIRKDLEGIKSTVNSLEDMAKKVQGSKS